MEIIEQIGSYAGLAAVVGLAVLSALYFSQARDVKRLREWAGRAPERAPVSIPQHRVVTQPVKPPAQQGAPGSPPQVPVPPGAPGGARPAAAGAGPAVSPGPYAATPAAARAAETATGTDQPSAVSQNTVAHPPPRPPPQTLAPRQSPPGLGGHFAREAQMARAREEAQRRERELAAGDQTDDERLEDEQSEGEELDDEELEDHELEAHEEDADPGEDGMLDPDDESVDHEQAAHPSAQEPAVTRPAPPPPPPVMGTRQPLPPRPPPPRPRSASPQGPILPPYERSRPGGGSWESRTFSPRKVALAGGATVVVVAAVAFGVLELTGGDEGRSEPAGQSPRAPQAQAGARERASGKSAINPQEVTVSVLNGTTVGGLAAQLGDKLEGQGFQLGNVTNNTDQERAESVVLFAPGAEAEAKEVGRRLKINQREPIDPDSQTRAGDASVVVVTGSDLKQ